MDIGKKPCFQQGSIMVNLVSTSLKICLKRIVRQPMDFDGKFIRTIIHTIRFGNNDRNKRVIDNNIRRNIPRVSQSPTAHLIMDIGVVIIFFIFLSPDFPSLCGGPSTLCRSPTQRELR